jgi:hypothetical protein
MTKLMFSLAATAAVAGGFAALPTPAKAQQGQAEIIVYGNDPCPRQTESQIVVCVHRPENERYRLPKNQQLQGSRQERQSWANKSQQVMTAGATGINSCSPVGPGGHAGCMIQQIQREKQDAREQTELNTAPEQ